MHLVTLKDSRKRVNLIINKIQEVYDLCDDEDEFLVKKDIGSDIKNMDGRYFPTHWEMLPEDRPGEKTTFTYLKIQFNYPVDESFFSERNMKKVR